MYIASASEIIKELEQSSFLNCHHHTPAMLFTVLSTWPSECSAKLKQISSINTCDPLWDTQSGQVHSMWEWDLLRVSHLRGGNWTSEVPTVQRLMSSIQCKFWNYCCATAGKGKLWGRAAAAQIGQLESCPPLHPITGLEPTAWEYCSCILSYCAHPWNNPVWK